MVHRDLKPSNIFLHRDGSGRIVPKLVDFGISKVAATPNAGELTRTGTIIGSPRYMSPEQAAGRKDVDARADVHGLGITLWTCAAGQSPFDASNYNTMIVSVIASERPRLRTVVPEVPEAVSEVVARAIERNREQRFVDGHELARALEAVRGAVRDGSGLGENRWTAPEAVAPVAEDLSVSFDLALYIRTADGVALVSTTRRRTESARALHAAAAVCAAVVTIALVLVAGRLALPERASQPATPAALPAPVAPRPPAPSGAVDAPPLTPVPLVPEPSSSSPPRLAGPVHAPPALPRSPPPREREQDDPHHGVTSSGL